jgi:hypothetical protein
LATWESVASPAAVYCQVPCIFRGLVPLGQLARNALARRKKAEKSSRAGVAASVPGTLSVESYADDVGWCESVPVKITLTLPPVLVAGLPLHAAVVSGARE